MTAARQLPPRFKPQLCADCPGRPHDGCSSQNLIMPTDLATLACELEDGPAHQFRDWPATHFPTGPSGVYTIWNESSFIYVGMSYAHRNDLDNAKTKGVFGRLASHATGRRSGDQFCIYICDRYVVPHLNVADMEALASGARLLDARTRDFIHDVLSYRVVVTASGTAARTLELLIRREGLPRAGRPQINP